MSKRNDRQAKRHGSTGRDIDPLAIAARGWPVFPCSPQTKQPLVKGDIDPKSKKVVPGTGGLKKATKDANQIREWWRRFPNAMIGVPTGAAIGAFVVDIDAGVDNQTGETFDALELLRNLENRVSVKLPETWVCRTPRGGLHLYFKATAAAMPRNRAGLIPRVDIRGEGGYVILPPSARTDGEPYRWESHPDDVSLADAPPELMRFLGQASVSRRGDGGRNHVQAIASPNYGLTALQREIDSLRNALEGTRNDHLFRSSINLAQLVAAGHLDGGIARGALASVVRGWPNRQKSLGTIESGFSRGLQDPRKARAARVEAQHDGRNNAATAYSLSCGADSLENEAEQVRLDGELGHCARTDLGNAERFARRMANRMIWVPSLGWFRWDGRRWTRKGADEAAKTEAQHAVRRIQREANALRGSPGDVVVEVRSPGAKFEREIRLSDKLVDWGRESESDRHLSAVLKQAAPMMAVDHDRLNADPFKINAKNGTFEVRRGGTDEDPIVFRPHDPADLITKMIDAEYDPAATCPTYDAFLEKVQPLAQVRRFLHQWAGLALTGDTSEQKLAFFWGKGRNGKTTLVEGWAGIFSDFACSLPIETFMDNGRSRNGGQATPDLAMLPGIRFVHTDEPARNAKLSESHVKLLTGGDTIQARELNKGFFSFKPEFKLTMSGNYRPRVDGGEASQGTWRRLILVRWSVTIAEQEVDRHLPAKLKQESCGILNRMLDGLRDWLDHGLQVPDEVKEATEDYRRDSDLLGRFLDECTEAEPDGRISNGELYRVFCVWAKSNGDTVWTQKGLTGAMQERGFVQARSDERYWRDIKLLKSVADFAAALPSEVDQPQDAEETES